MNKNDDEISITEDSQDEEDVMFGKRRVSRLSLRRNSGGSQQLNSSYQLYDASEDRSLNEVSSSIREMSRSDREKSDSQTNLVEIGSSGIFRKEKYRKISCEKKRKKRISRLGKHFRNKSKNRGNEEEHVTEWEVDAKGSSVTNSENCCDTVGMNIQDTEGIGRTLSSHIVVNYQDENNGKKVTLEKDKIEKQDTSQVESKEQHLYSLAEFLSLDKSLSSSEEHCSNGDLNDQNTEMPASMEKLRKNSPAPNKDNSFPVVSENILDTKNKNAKKSTEKHRFTMKWKKRFSPRKKKSEASQENNNLANSDSVTVREKNGKDKEESKSASKSKEERKKEKQQIKTEIKAAKKAAELKKIQKKIEDNKEEKEREKKMKEELKLKKMQEKQNKMAEKEAKGKLKDEMKGEKKKNIKSAIKKKWKKRGDARQAVLERNRVYKEMEKIRIEKEREETKKWIIEKMLEKEKIKLTKNLAKAKMEQKKIEIKRSKKEENEREKAIKEDLRLRKKQEKHEKEAEEGRRKDEKIKSKRNVMRFIRKKLKVKKDQEKTNSERKGVSKEVERKQMDQEGEENEKRRKEMEHTGTLTNRNGSDNTKNECNVRNKENGMQIKIVSGIERVATQKDVSKDTNKNENITEKDTETKGKNRCSADSQEGKGTFNGSRMRKVPVAWEDLSKAEMAEKGNKRSKKKNVLFLNKGHDYSQSNTVNKLAEIKADDTFRTEILETEVIKDNFERQKGQKNEGLPGKENDVIEGDGFCNRVHDFIEYEDSESGTEYASSGRSSTKRSEIQVKPQVHRHWKQQFVTSVESASIKEDKNFYNVGQNRDTKCELSEQCDEGNDKYAKTYINTTDHPANIKEDKESDKENEMLDCDKEDDWSDSFSVASSKPSSQFGEVKNEELKEMKKNETEKEKVEENSKVIKPSNKKKSEMSTFKTIQDFHQNVDDGEPEFFSDDEQSSGATVPEVISSKELTKKKEEKNDQENEIENGWDIEDLFLADQFNDFESLGENMACMTNSGPKSIGTSAQEEVVKEDPELSNEIEQRLMDEIRALKTENDLLKAKSKETQSSDNTSSVLKLERNDSSSKTFASNDSRSRMNVAECEGTPEWEAVKHLVKTSQFESERAKKKAQSARVMVEAAELENEGIKEKLEDSQREITRMKRKLENMMDKQKVLNEKRTNEAETYKRVFEEKENTICKLEELKEKFLATEMKVREQECQLLDYEQKSKDYKDRNETNGSRLNENDGITDEIDHSVDVSNEYLKTKQRIQESDNLKGKKFGGSKEITSSGLQGKLWPTEEMTTKLKKENEKLKNDIEINNASSRLEKYKRELEELKKLSKLEEDKELLETTRQEFVEATGNLDKRDKLVEEPREEMEKLKVDAAKIEDGKEKKHIGIPKGGNIIHNSEKQSICDDVHSLGLKSGSMKMVTNQQKLDNKR